jgi:hypothetical protein
MEIRHEYSWHFVLHALTAIRICPGTIDLGLGLGAMDETADSAVDDLINSVIRRVPIRDRVGTVRVMDDSLRVGRGIRAHPKQS